MIAFNNHFMLFDRHLEPYQRADDVGYAISEFLWFEGRPFYPVSALAQARVAQVNLCASYGREDNQDNCDLIFQMPKVDGGHFYEIVMRSDAGTSYGGWAWGETLECLDQCANGHRILRARSGTSQVMFEYSTQCRRYEATSKLILDKASSHIDKLKRS